jgi:hypothetical protein
MPFVQLTPAIQRQPSGIVLAPWGANTQSVPADGRSPS